MKDIKPVLPNCPRCENLDFDCAEIPCCNGTVFIEYIYCSKCGCIVGVIDNQVRNGLDFISKYIEKKRESNS